jgi:caa(3)-type oxidase subunit IV
MSEEAHEDHSAYYIKIWAILVVLLIVSVAGPMVGIFWLTMVTAFGIACVKAYLVVTRFMHISEEPTFVRYLVVTALVFMLLFFAAVAPDVMKPEGSNWIKPAWLAESAESAADHHAPAPH